MVREKEYIDSMVHKVTKDTFSKDVLEKKGVVFVDFYADWCGPCKSTEPIVEEISNEMDAVSFVKVDVDANQELASQYSVFSIPTFIMFKDGKVAGQIVGAFGKEKFIEEINKVIK
jgi:thioredoxin 1